MATYDSLISRTDAAALIPEQYLAEVQQGSIANSTFLSMAQKLPNMVRGQERMAVMNALPTAYFVEETGLRQTTEVSWQNKYIYAAELALIIPIPQAVVDDSDYPIWDQCMPLLGQAAGAAVDAAVYIGTGAPASWPTPIKTAAVAAGMNVAATAFSGSGDQQYYDTFLAPTGLFSKLEQKGFMVSGVVGVPSVAGLLRGVKDDNGNPIFLDDSKIAGRNVRYQDNNAFTSSDALAFAGDFKKLVYSFRQDMQYAIDRSGIIQDGAGNIIYNLLQQRMVAMVMWMRLGWQAPNPPTLLAQTEATRYPVGVLTAS